MKKLLFILTLFLPTILLGQNISDSLLTTFYNRTLFYYFSDTIRKDYKKYGTTIIQTDHETKNLIKQVGQNRFKFINSNTKIQRVLKRPYKKNNYRPLYSINHKPLGKDTIDINIDFSIIEKANRQKIYYYSICGGIGQKMYIPDGRFIYNKGTNNWNFTTGQELVDEEDRKWKKE